MQAESQTFRSPCRCRCCSRGPRAVPKARAAGSTPPFPGLRWLQGTSSPGRTKDGPRGRHRPPTPRKARRGGPRSTGPGRAARPMPQCPPWTRRCPRWGPRCRTRLPPKPEAGSWSRMEPADSGSRWGSATETERGCARGSRWALHLSWHCCWGMVCGWRLYWGWVTGSWMGTRRARLPTGAVSGWRGWSRETLVCQPTVRTHPGPRPPPSPRGHRPSCQSLPVAWPRCGLKW